MEEQSITERRGFFKWLGMGLLALVALLVGDSIGEHRRFLRNQSKRLKIPMDIPEGVSFFDDVIVVHTGKAYEALSAHCTHLGCLVDKREGNNLVCPCHGSRYSLEGKLLKGPATRDLTALRVSIDKKEKSLIIERPA
jgi:Rieske Fe-S protein